MTPTVISVLDYSKVWHTDLVTASIRAGNYERCLSKRRERALLPVWRCQSAPGAAPCELPQVRTPHTETINCLARGFAHPV